MKKYCLVQSVEQHGYLLLVMYPVELHGKNPETQLYLILQEMRFVDSLMLGRVADERITDILCGALLEDASVFVLFVRIQSF